MSVTRVESKGSIWLLDDDRMVYLRMPKTEKPRESPPGDDWGGAGAGPLQDLKWHPMVRWNIDPPFEPYWSHPVLRIYVTDDDSDRISAPRAQVVR